MFGNEPAGTVEAAAVKGLLDLLLEVGCSGFTLNYVTPNCGEGSVSVNADGQLTETFEGDVLQDKVSLEELRAAWMQGCDY